MTEGYVEKSFDASQDDIEKINCFTRTEFSAENLYVFSVALCNNDIDRDYEKFSIEALNELAAAFIGKTGISDHSMKASDQKARIFETWVEKTEGKTTADGEDFYQLKAKAYMLKNEENMPFITEIEAGIKKEVSVSCSMGKSVCSICDTDKKSGRCEHIAGKSYNGRLAYRILSEVKDAYEFSFVAVPAQREAGVTKSFDLTKEDVNMTEIIDTLKSCDAQLVISKNQANEIIDYIDNLETEAQLGRTYKKGLADEVISLCAVAMPDMDIKTFGGVAQVMTANELLAFKKAFSKVNHDNKSAHLQFIGKADDNNKFQQFKI